MASALLDTLISNHMACLLNWHYILLTGKEAIQSYGDFGYAWPFYQYSQFMIGQQPPVWTG